ncbi:MAG: hypothetical protein K0S81_2837 [Rhodospirillales bacterium]|nr:hypothetical protein [Rhodospirillales bacterium]
MSTPKNPDRKKQPKDSGRREKPAKDRAEPGRPEVNEGDVNEQVKREEERQVIDNPGAL